MKILKYLVKSTIVTGIAIAIQLIAYQFLAKENAEIIGCAITFIMVYIIAMMGTCLD